MSVFDADVLHALFEKDYAESDQAGTIVDGLFNRDDETDEYVDQGVASRYDWWHRGFLVSQNLEDPEE